MIDLLNKIHPLRKCQTIPNKPCLYYHMGQCLAPCIKKVDEEEYQKIVEEITRFFNGDNESLVSSLRRKMKEDAAKLGF